MKKRYVILIVFLVIVLSILVISTVSKHNIEKETYAYLMSQKHYQSNDISYLHAMIGKAPVLTVEVHFSDEPGLRYFYKKEEGQIIQYNTAPPRGSDVNKSYEYKHKEYTD